MTGEELRQKIEMILPILDVIARFVPGSIDNRGVEYVRAVSKSSELLKLLAEDITNIGGLEAISVTPEGALTIVGPGRERALGDGAILRRLIELAPMIIELLKLFKGL